MLPDYYLQAFFADQQARPQTHPLNVQHSLNLSLLGSSFTSYVCTKYLALADRCGRVGYQALRSDCQQTGQTMTGRPGCTATWQAGACQADLHICSICECL
jgi:hypothetical protein